MSLISVQFWLCCVWAGHWANDAAADFAFGFSIRALGAPSPMLVIVHVRPGRMSGFCALRKGCNCQKWSNERLSYHGRWKLERGFSTSLHRDRCSLTSRTQ
ncbi:hypothetical protein CPB83DRAFT_852016 [Crepidotus variabilis]|uniref:Secreted protein n=1 Tax=Crepidotus variabilis TaxID=179855 RepID=A0A9P6EII8_9AGAR|nr:hypothetical protein CPB83DRAFT_852016 [Crepidotus variabilis]